MLSNSQAQAVLLLTVSFGKTGNAAAKPLSKKEWAKFAVWLNRHDLQPSSLLKGRLDVLLSRWEDHTITLSRLENLLGRGGALGLALEKWHRAGLWILTRSDSEYPGRLRKRLKAESPPVLFGCGNKRLLNQGGIAAVGSRNATEGDLTFTNNLGVAAAAQGHSIVSGGARGVDQAAMFAALQSEGTVVGVLANNLLRSVTSAEYRKHLKTNNLVLVSPFNPEAGFNVGNMMARNRYIYCLADAAVVVSSTANKGGTWHGAIEDLKAGWVPLWVKKSCTANSGNTELVCRGAKEWSPNDFSNLINLFENVQSSKGPLIPDDLDFNQLFLHHLTKWTSNNALTRNEIGKRLKRLNINENQVSTWLQWGVAEKRIRKMDARIRYQCEKQPFATDAPLIPDDLDFNQLFLHHLTKWTSNNALTRNEIGKRLKRLNINENQVSAWLEWGVAEKRIRKMDARIRYQCEKQPFATDAPLIPDDLDFNQLFLHRLTKWTSNEALTPNEISERLNVKKNQVIAWLKWGMGEARIQKLNNPIRYQYERQKSLLPGSS